MAAVARRDGRGLVVHATGPRTAAADDRDQVFRRRRPVPEDEHETIIIIRRPSKRRRGLSTRLFRRRTTDVRLRRRVKCHCFNLKTDSDCRRSYYTVYESEILFTFFYFRKKRDVDTSHRGYFS